MSLSIRFFSIVLLKSAVEVCYPHGVEGFRSTYQGLGEDEGLLRLCAMSRGDLESLQGELASYGLTSQCSYAIADGLSGPIESCHGIEIGRTLDDFGLFTWMARWTGATK